MRTRIISAIVVLGAAVIAAGASADFKSVNDPRGDTMCFHDAGFAPKPCSDSKRRNADIVRTTAGHDGASLKHTIRVVGEIRAGGLFINTDSDRDCEFFLQVRRDTDVRECAKHAPVTGPARHEFHRHSVEISFSKESIGNPQSYGWQVGTDSLGKDYLHADAVDFAPNPVDYIEHQAGVMALGAQTPAAAPGVVKYDTESYITKEYRIVEGGVESEVRKCMEGRRVILFKLRPGTDRKIGTARTVFKYGRGDWGVLKSSLKLQDGRYRLYAKVRRKVGDQFVCRADRSANIWVSCCHKRLTARRPSGSSATRYDGAGT